MHGTVGYLSRRILGVYYCVEAMDSMWHNWKVFSLNSPSLEESGHDRHHSGQ